MRDLKDFTRAEWIRLLPLQHGFKQVRNDILQNIILRQRPKTLEKFLENNAHLKGKNLAQVVAFGQPGMLDFFLKMAGRHLADATVLVFDNSRQISERAEIERVCHEHHVPYLGLPWIPARHANRSHGIAMTWIFHRVVQAIQPARTCFMDYDLIPTERIECAKALGDRPFYGITIIGKWGWALWAGYCMYDFSAVSALPLNFLYDFSRGLDTGARNWDCLYKHHDRSKLKLARFQFEEVIDPTTGTPRKMECVEGRWIHLRGVTCKKNFGRNMDFSAHITAAVDEGASLQQILAAMKSSR
jgi:hypothetical protein